MEKLKFIKNIESKIFVIRGERVMVDRDLAELYEVSTKVLNQAVQRNISRFPEDFMFRLTKKEKDEVVTNCDHLKKLKFSSQLPHVFTEHGVAMLSGVLKSQRAVEISIYIIRTFIRMRKLLIMKKEFAVKLKELEGKLGTHDRQIQAIFQALHQLMSPPEKPKKRIGFHRD